MSYGNMVQNINFPKTNAALNAAWATYNAAHKDGEPWNGPVFDKPWESPTWTPASTSTTDYRSWESALRHSSWQQIMQTCADVVQLNFLRAITVSGIATYKWTDLFYKFNQGREGWGELKKIWFTTQTVPRVWDFFELVVRESGYTTHYPAAYPEWLVPYGFTQPQYIEDLQKYWYRVADVYFELWPDTRYGLDTPEIAAIRRIGREAQQQIEALGDMAYGYLPSSDSANDYIEDEVDEEEVYW
jgi:hypothetical protein